ncbi:3-deoxy-manno-octulosonate cytidylyltransferase [Dokdonia sp. Hel_I_53]|uniref:3-deoxy-manno-octulosonate cytidylyltransferase n=1 Tax=Dokdonia sp. Hel_I_53 TaxID=1566287 RepID=UPI00119A4453|nr:3-deoxy-manno-octulosonate cytidylyltransferase [Dokdonia sp. Hel_I_53]TVZ51325.1 3-deoxy-manno-octulosonate cytidylyltransferase (CMP-KDO synthetase)/3-deoxy-alpha-D-manno-octulosonate 8-oxidase [Dokdonia sp. Hel_I_53]
MIPARYAASRFPGKMMADLAGKPVIVRTYESTVATGLFDQVYVVTDNEEIAQAINNYGGKAIMSVNEHECGSDRIAEAVQPLDVDIVVNVQGDEPFTTKEDLSPLLDVFYETDADKIDLASVMMPMSSQTDIEDPNNVKVIVDTKDFALYFSRSPIPFIRDIASETVTHKHKGIYAFRKKALLDFAEMQMTPLERAEKVECIRFLEYGKKIKMVRSPRLAIGIDTPEDLIKANKIYKNN